MDDEYEDPCPCDNVTDIDIHRYECNDCGTIGYYSGAAKDYYEEGKTCDVVAGLGVVK